MNERTRTGLEILQLAVVLGVLGDVLLRQTPWGLNVLLFNLAFVGGTIMLLRRHAPERLTGQAIALFAAQIFLAGMFVWRDSIELRVANTFAIIAILGVLFLPTLKITARVAGLFQYAIGFVWAALNSLFAGFAVFAVDIRWSEIAMTGWRKNIVSVLRGLIIALPLLLIFGALFMAADAVYDGWVRRTLNFDLELTLGHIALFAVFGWLSAGYLRGILLAGTTTAVEVPLSIMGPEGPDSNESPMAKVRAESGEYPVTLPDNRTVVEHVNAPETSTTPKTAPRVEAPEAPPSKKLSWADFDNSVVQGATLGSVEVGVILGLINLLFLSFVIFQLPYLFGGMDLVQNTPDFKLAEYARRGFGELVAVAALVLPVLLVSHWLLRKDDRTASLLYRVLAGVQIVLLFVIMASAVQRIVLLTGNLGYGMTTVRLYPLIFMTWLAVVFIWFGATVLRGARKHFAWGALWSALFILGATHVFNPDEFIVRHNLALMREGREFDAGYNGQLSDDALQVLTDSVGQLNDEDRQVLSDQLSRRYCEKHDESDIRSWNLSRHRASIALKATGETIGGSDGCDSVPKRSLD